MTVARNAFTPDQEAWLTALESGNFDQIREHLCSEGGYCCLGVATHAIDPNHKALAEDGWAWDWYEGDNDSGDLWDEGERPYEDGSFAPPEVVSALHLGSSDGRFRFGFSVTNPEDHNRAGCLADLNDKLRWSFDEIAAFIRRNPWWVFHNFDMPTPPQTEGDAG